jgi:hypothetical protein
MSININPSVQTNFAGTFSVQSDGYIQGLFMDDPAVRYALAGGPLGPDETLPMWGGVAILDSIGGGSAQASALGNIVTRAADYAHVTGFSVFNQNASAIVTPQSGVPLVTNGMNVNFFRMGSGARIVVLCDSTLAAALAGGDASNTEVSWDFTNQKLIAFSSTALPVKVLGVNIGNSKVVAYDSGTGFANWTVNGDTALIQI